jgi:hypothetical protein
MKKTIFGIYFLGPRPSHNRCTRADTFFRWVMAVTHGHYKFLIVPLPNRFRNGRFASETAL